MADSRRQALARVWPFSVYTTSRGLRPLKYFAPRG